LRGFAGAALTSFSNGGYAVPAALHDCGIDAGGGRKVAALHCLHPKDKNHPKAQSKKAMTPLIKEVGLYVVAKRMIVTYGHLS